MGLLEGTQVVFDNQVVVKLETTAVGKVDAARSKVSELSRNHALTKTGQTYSD